MEEENHPNQRNERSTLDKTVMIAGTALAIDGIIVPFFSGGQTLHEMIGIPASGNYEIAGEGRTVQRMEAALWGVAMFYQIGKDWYNNKYKS